MVAHLRGEATGGVIGRRRKGMEQATVPGSLLVTVEDAGRVLGVGRSTVFDLIAAGQLRSVKIGRSRRVSVRAFEEFVRALEAGEVAPRRRWLQDSGRSRAS